MEFKCKEGNKCIPQSMVCDGRIDCKDHSDEVDCPAGSMCILGSWKCDGEEDCHDGSDEWNCNSCCKTGEFRYWIGSCISILWQCNGENDCQDQLDEQGCSSLACAIGRFRCNNHKCIPLRKKCDGVIDCEEGHDEDVCVISKYLYGTYPCKNGGKCLKSWQLCDGVKDCDDDDGDNDDGDDEADKICAKEKLLSCGALNGGCSHNCIYLYEVHMTKCSCPPGFVLDKGETACIAVQLALLAIDVRPTYMLDTVLTEAPVVPWMAHPPVGKRCEKFLDNVQCEGYCLNGGTCLYDRKGQRKCTVLKTTLGLDVKAVVYRDPLFTARMVELSYVATRIHRLVAIVCQVTSNFPTIGV